MSASTTHPALVLLVDVLGQVAAVRVLHRHREVVLRQEDLPKLDDVGVHAAHALVLQTATHCCERHMWDWREAGYDRMHWKQGYRTAIAEETLRASAAHGVDTTRLASPAIPWRPPSCRDPNAAVPEE